MLVSRAAAEDDASTNLSALPSMRMRLFHHYVDDVTRMGFSEAFWDARWAWQQHFTQLAEAKQQMQAPGAAAGPQLDEASSSALKPPWLVDLFKDLRFCVSAQRAHADGTQAISPLELIYWGKRADVVSGVEDYVKLRQAVFDKVRSDLTGTEGHKPPHRQLPHSGKRKQPATQAAQPRGGHKKKAAAAAAAAAETAEPAAEETAAPGLAAPNGKGQGQKRPRKGALLVAAAQLKPKPKPKGKGKGRQEASSSQSEAEEEEQDDDSDEDDAEVEAEEQKEDESAMSHASASSHSSDEELPLSALFAVSSQRRAVRIGVHGQTDMDSEVERIVRMEVADGVAWYLVKWAQWDEVRDSPDSPDWFTEDKLHGCEELIKQFKAEQQTLSRQERSERVKRRRR